MKRPVDFWLCSRRLQYSMGEQCPFHLACTNGHYKSAETLLNDGYDVNSRDSDGRTPLMWACSNGHTDIVIFLLSREAAVNVQDKDGWSALMLASKAGHSNVLKVLIENGAQMNIQKNNGWSALMLASGYGHSDSVEVLTEKGAQVNMQKNDGWSVLMAASRNGHSYVVKVLVEKGAQVNMQKNDGYSALMTASREGRSDVVKVLIEKGAQVNMQKNDGWSALMTASRNGCCDVVKILIEKGAEVNMQSKDGWSALMTASHEGRCDVVRVLIEKGAEMDMYNNDGKSALILACYKGRKEIAQILLDHNADTSIQDTVGKTALTWACEKRYTEIVQLLQLFNPEDTSADHEPPAKRTKIIGKKSPELSLNVLSMELKTVTDPIRLGVGLGVKQHRLEIIKKNNPHDVGQQQLDLFSFVANNCIVLDITWKKIADTLEEFVGMGDLAQKIRSKFNIVKRQTAAATCSNTEYISDDLLLFKDKPIGSGAFGSVFRGEVNGERCAIKLLHAVASEIRTDIPTASLASTDSAERFRKECEFLESFQHRNIVRHLATKKHPKTNHLVLALELMDCNLRQYFTPQPDKESVKLSIATQTSLCHDIASALEYIHSRGVVHRDLCGDNILLSCGGEIPVAKICDFGMSRITKNDTRSVSLQAFAHKGYMPPEATDMESSCYNSKFDIYSFGALMVQIVRHLPTLKDRNERSFELKVIESSHPIKEIIIDCLNENRDDRPSTTHVKRRLKVLYERSA